MKCIDSKKLGFTLAELLAVVIILVIMSAVGAGYYKRSVEQARFSEGLMAASAIAEGVNREYLRTQMEGASPITRPPLKSLDIMISKNKSCAISSAYCVKTKNFEISVEANGVTKAYRGITSKYKYYIAIQPHFASSNKDQIACVGTSSGVSFDGKSFCQGLGYTSCAGNSCVKP